MHNRRENQVRGGDVDSFQTVVDAVLVAIATGTLGYLIKFVKEQRAVNAANQQANRAMQRDVILRYFAKAVEHGEELSVQEMECLEATYRAYSANHGNGTARLMYERTKEHARVKTSMD